MANAIEIYKRIINGEKIIVIDVREKEKFQSFHIPGAIHFEKGYVIENCKLVFPKDKKSFITCNSGNSASMIAEIARKSGLDVESVEGGMNPLIIEIEKNN